MSSNELGFASKPAAPVASSEAVRIVAQAPDGARRRSRRAVVPASVASVDTVSVRVEPLVRVVGRSLTTGEPTAGDSGLSGAVSVDSGFAMGVGSTVTPVDPPLETTSTRWSRDVSGASASTTTLKSNVR